MLGAERLLADRERALKERLGLGVAAGGLVEIGQIAETIGDLRVLRAESLLVDSEGALEERLGLTVTAGGLVETGQVIEPGGEVGVLQPQRLLADRERTRIERLGLGVAAGVLVEQGEVVEVGAEPDILGRQSCLVQGQDAACHVHGRPVIAGTPGGSGPARQAVGERFRIRLRREPDRLGVVASCVSIADLGHHQIAVLRCSFRSGQLARVEIGLQPRHGSLHLLDGRKVTRLGQVQELLGPGEIAPLESLLGLLLEPLHFGIGRARGLEPGQQILVALGDLDQLGLELLRRHIGLAQDGEEPPDRFGAHTARSRDQRIEPVQELGIVSGPPGNGETHELGELLVGNAADDADGAVRDTATHGRGTVGGFGPVAEKLGRCRPGRGQSGEGE